MRFASKLTWQATQTTNLELSVFGRPTVQDLIYPFPSGITSVTKPDPLLGTLKTGGTIASLLTAFVAFSPELALEELHVFVRDLVEALRAKPREEVDPEDRPERAPRHCPPLGPDRTRPSGLDTPASPSSWYLE